MTVRLLRCSACQTEVQGAFSLDRFSRLSPENLNFLEIFIRCRGSLKDVGAILDISYPTARNRLDALIAALGFEDTSSAAARRMDILTQLKEGLITTEEALIALGENNN
jgi:hypothetical protein